jgi:acyl-homoserine-lactone acylase
MRHQLSLTMLLLPLLTVGSSAVGKTPKILGPSASIRITGHGVFHVLAKDYTGLGFGVGYAQASEAICDIASRIVTVNGERSLYFGPDRMTGDFLNNPRNLDSDFFWKRIADIDVVGRELKLPAPIGPSVELRQTIQGYVAGYNKYLAETGVSKLPDARCRGADWVRPITEKDVYLRALHWNLFRSGGMMVGQIVAAAPPHDTMSSVDLMDNVIEAEVARGYGSNMIALGGDSTDNGQGMLFANPHWIRDGSDRWMEMQITIPGKINAIGMQTLGLPVIQTGFNQNTAWAGTTSVPMRYTLYRLKLGRTPTSYIEDGVERKMTARTVRVQVRDANGAIEAREHVFWETPTGLLVTDPAFGWTKDTAYVMRDVGYTFRWLSQMLRLNTAKSAEDLAESGKHYMAVGWRNLSAADDQGNVIYVDRTAVPGVSDELLAKCEIKGLSSRVFVLDGQRSSCGWQSFAGAPVPGILSADELPQLHRRDYIAQSNDTHWLNNLRQPLEGYPKIIGADRTMRQLRTRNALQKVETRLAGTDGYPGNRFTLNLLKRITMDNRVFSADIWLADTVKFCADQAERKIVEACHAIATWDGTENIDSPGALMWRHFASAVLDLSPKGELFAVPFDVKHPVQTPRGLKIGDPRVREAMLKAISQLDGAGIAYDATLRNYQYAQKGSERIPIGGGSARVGQYNAVGDLWTSGSGYGPVLSGATFIMWMQFTPKGPVGESIFTPSQSPNSASPFYADQTRMWSEMKTKPMRFTEADILADPELKTLKVCAGTSC